MCLFFIKNGKYLNMKQTAVFSQQNSYYTYTINFIYIILLEQKKKYIYI